MSTTYLIPITRLCYHDFKDNLDELFELAPGKRMSISIEHDNPQERDAVIVYYLDKCVGYIRSGKDRETAYSLIKNSGKDSLLGRIVDTDRRKQWLIIEISSDIILPTTIIRKPNLLSEWSYDGELLPQDEKEVRLSTMLSNLQQVIENDEPLDEDAEFWLSYIENNFWRDISLETFNKVQHILELLMAGATKHREYDEVAIRMQCAIDRMGSPEVRLMQFNWIIEKARSKEMDFLMAHHDTDAAKQAVCLLPDELATLFLKDGEMIVGRLWYLHLPQSKVRALFTLLSMLVHQKENDQNNLDNRYIEKESLLLWASQQKDSQKAAVIKEFISDHEIKRTNPTLAKQIAELRDSCNPAKQTEENLQQIAKSIAEKQIHNDIAQMVVGGTAYQTLHTDPEQQRKLEA